MANWYADEIKGSNWSLYPAFIVKGAQLHREMDDFTDNHAALLKLKKSLYTELPKVAPIAVDLYIDHVLTKNWALFHPQPYNDFLEQFYQFAYQEIKSVIPMPNGESFRWSSSFKAFLDIFYSRKFMNQYPELSGLRRASFGLSRRISFPNKLANATAVYLKHQEKVDEQCLIFLKDAQKYFGVQKTIFMD
ncbi:MAG: DUF479 domain-containing protein [Crocinitomicaceae bacterium]|nr:DUF479 domain-containing protein [Crocinitomicaceae bacterium]